MKEVRSYTNIWKVERMFYGVNDLRLPRPVPMLSVAWAAGFFFLSMILNGIPPFVFTDSAFTNHVGLPVMLAWVVSRLKYDGRSPTGVCVSVFRYLMRPRVMVRGRAVHMQDIVYPELIITVARKRIGGKRDGTDSVSDQISGKQSCVQC